MPDTHTVQSVTAYAAPMGDVHKATEGVGRIRATCGSGGYQLAEAWDNVTCSDCLAVRPAESGPYTEAALEACADIERLLRDLRDARLRRDENAALMHLKEGKSAAAVGRLIGFSTSRVRLAVTVFQASHK